MKNPTEQEIIDEIDWLIKDMKHNWSKWSDCSCWVLEDTLKRLRRIKRLTKMPKRIEFTGKRNGKKVKINFNLKK